MAMRNSTNMSLVQMDLKVPERSLRYLVCIYNTQGECKKLVTDTEETARSVTVTTEDILKNYREIKTSGGNEAPPPPPPAAPEADERHGK